MREALWTAKQVAEYLGIKPSSVRELGVPAIKLGHRTVRYSPADVEAWLESKR